MYGFIYNILRQMVVTNHGEGAWTKICEQAGTPDFCDGILTLDYYDESALFKIGAAASEMLGVPLDQIFESFGEFFFQTIRISGHSSMLRTLGQNLYGFLINLDALHDHLSFTYTEMQAPSFRCEKTPYGLTLHYYSKRMGLEQIVSGIVKAVAKNFYSLVIDVVVHDYEKTQQDLCHHYTLHIEVTDKSDENYVQRLIGDSSFTEVVLPRFDSDVDLLTESTHTMHTAAHTMHTAASQLSSTTALSAPTLASCPFHHGGRKSCTTGQVMVTDPEVLLSLEEREEESDLGYDLGPAPSPMGEQDGVTQQQLRQLRAMLPMLNHGHYTSTTSMHRSLTPSILPALPSRMNSRRGSALQGFVDLDWPISPHLFQICFPFHIIFDRDLTIRHMGISLFRLFPRAIASGGKISDYFDLSRPAMKLTYENIRNSTHNVFILTTKRPPATAKRDTRETIQFRGQMVPTSSLRDAPILYIASPRIHTVKELELQGLYLSDIPIHDVTRDLILLNRHFQVEMKIALELETTQRNLQIQKAQVQEQKERADKLLHSMLPPSVALELKSSANASATEYPMVTILFSDIKDFTTICNQRQAMEVVGMLNNLYTRFDNLLDKHNVYKVETIGDAYMVAAGLLDTSTSHAMAITNMAFDMREEAGKVMKPTTDEQLQIRIGIHSGPVVAGVVGTKMPRYCLFGNTVNTASRMESHGHPGCVHISDTTYQFLKGRQYEFFSRGEINVKGLGLKRTYFVEPTSEADDGTTRIFVESQDSDSDSNSLCDESGTTRKDMFLRSPSFVKYHQIRPVTPTNSGTRLAPGLDNPFTNSTFSLNELGIPTASPVRHEMTRPPIQGGELVPPGVGNGRVSRASNASAASSIFIVAPDTRPQIDVGFVSESHSDLSDAGDVSAASAGAKRGKKPKSKSKRKHKGCRIS